MNGPRVQALFERCRHNTVSIFIISPNHYKLSKRTIRAKGKETIIFSNQVKLEMFRDKVSTKMKLIETKIVSF